MKKRNGATKRGLGPEMTGNTANIDEVEVARFSALASKWWDAKGEFGALHRLGPARMAFIRDQLLGHFGHPVAAIDGRVQKPLEGLKIVDIGCGGGLVTEPLCRMGARVTGIDPGPDNVAAARAHAKIDGLDIDYRALSVEAVAEGGEVFDAVVCLEVIEHVPDPKAFIGVCARLVRPGGMLIVSTINRTLKSYGLAIVAAEYVLDWVPRGTHDWQRFVTDDELAAMLVSSGLTAPALRGLVYNPMGNDWQLSADVAVNYMAASVKPAQISEA